jgi:hypothetical protein
MEALATVFSYKRSGKSYTPTARDMQNISQRTNCQISSGTGTGFSNRKKEAGF